MKGVFFLKLILKKQTTKKACKIYPDGIEDDI